MRIRLDIAYDGTDFHGWATQPGLRTVEGVLSAALATVHRVPEVRLTCAGRTDSGVHARGQVVHVDLDELPEGPERLARRLNGLLDRDCRVRRVSVVPETFDARFSALWRRYAYRVVDHPGAVDPLARAHVLVWGRRVDEAAMNQAAQALLGLHDFTSFCKQREGATTIRTLEQLSWARDEAGVVVGTVVADAFCHSMVRSLVGCLVAVGDGRQPVEWAGEILRASARNPGVTVLHAHGLTLERVDYPGDDEMAARADQTRAKRVAADG